MKKLIFLFVFLTSSALFAQSNLQFSEVIILSNTLEAVPAGKVWKVTAVYGSEDLCLNRNNPENATWTWRKLYVTNFYVNGVEIKSSEVDYQARRWCIDNSCGSCITNWPNDKLDRPANPNILPFWVPAGATIQSGGPNIFLSVLEFNVVQ